MCIVVLISLYFLSYFLYRRAVEVGWNRVSKGIARLIANKCIKTQSPRQGGTCEKVPTGFEANPTDFYSRVLV